MMNLYAKHDLSIDEDAIDLTSREITPDEVLLSYQKFEGKILTLNEKKRPRNLESRNISYISMNFVRPNKKKVHPIIFSFPGVPLGSGAKKPRTLSSLDDVRNFNIILREWDKSDILSNELLASSKSKDKKAESIFNNTQKTMLALKMLHEAYENLVGVIMKSKKGRTVTVNNTKMKFSSDNVNKLYQARRYDNDIDDYVNLDYPIFRFKLKVNPSTGKFGRTWNGVWKPVIYDITKATEKNDFMPQPAKVKVGNKLQDINRYNVEKYITYQSLVTGEIKFGDIIISSKGFSMSNEFQEINIRRKKPNQGGRKRNKKRITDLKRDNWEEEGSDVELEREEDEKSEESEFKPEPVLEERPKKPKSKSKLSRKERARKEKAKKKQELEDVIEDSSDEDGSESSYE